ncbi:MAG: hypothetical protein PXX77_05810 [Gallionella sp.]|nr:hypothetical protein [Gallionella sp.]
MSFMFPVVLVVIGFFFYRAFKKHSSTPTFDDYRNNYPELVKDGKITCHKCSGKDIFVKTIGKTPTSLLNHHLCKTCGTTLFRSST